MTDDLSRRSFLGVGAAAAAFSLAHPLPGVAAKPQEALHPRFPAQDDESVRAVVGASHFDFDRVRQLVTARPELAKASWDWGYGDWETALGAASHTGNHPIAEFLIEHGASPTLFSATALGQLEVVRGLIEASPGIQSQPGPHGINLLEHARLGGDRAKAVFDYLQSVGGADPQPAAQPYTIARDAYFGTYTFGSGAQDVLIAFDQRGALMLKRGEAGTGRGLTHLGDHVFHPAGAPSVRVVFEVEGEVPVRVSVLDPEPLVRAQRVG